MESAAPSDTRPSRTDIANRLTLQLFGIGLLAVLISALVPVLLGPVGPLGMVLLLFPYGLILWLVVHAVFAALEDLIQLKLAEQS
ncbi:hypothetical protein [Natronolimnobius baerhuensis]|uniref:Uncharacterized protein n=1 Tax=Natronolimnobius baerhuensis TaxID=253108 RepID=A0A202E6M4_9EURY|nr:hypothetical protein [Natronolimnobius baerhuensis]OVE83834.1 hypothetical protein B2G88_15555 [Natronolimnobius baerhuensis]